MVINTHCLRKCKNRNPDQGAVRISSQYYTGIQWLIWKDCRNAYSDSTSLCGYTNKLPSYIHMTIYTQICPMHVDLVSILNIKSFAVYVKGIDHPYMNIMLSFFYFFFQFFLFIIIYKCESKCPSVVLDPIDLRTGKNKIDFVCVSHRRNKVIN